MIIKPSSLGDVVHALPAVSAIRSRFPQAELHWLVNTEWAPILEDNPDLSGIIPFPRKQWTRGWRDLGKARAWAKEKFSELKPDWTIDFQGLLRSGLLARSSGAELKIGFQQAREGAPFFYTHKTRVENWYQTHAVDRYLQIPAALGCEIDRPKFKLPRGDSIELPDLTEKWILLHPFSRGKGKSLSFEEVAEFCRTCAPVSVAVVGAGVTWPSSSPFPENAIDLLGKSSLAQLIWLMRNAAWTVSVDSGPMHLAAGISDRVLSVHTWTDPLMVGPYPESAWIYREGQILQRQELAPGQFPENRKAKTEFSNRDSLLPDTEIARIAGFTVDQVLR
ncbi:MAG: glycosyltransferase family 9 protein [Verrucomicrobiales bacterium]|nr:glycosyltransferase family 9 protein [Verrucomicrobiales bacterium]